MNIKDKAQKVVVDEVIAIPVSDRFLDLIKESKRTTLVVVVIIAFIIWLI
jgi:phosphatidylglycerophosphatase A